MHAQNSANEIDEFKSHGQNLWFAWLSNFRPLITVWVTWPKHENVIGQKFCVFSKRVSFVFKQISEACTKIMHAQNLTNQIPVFRPRDQNWPIRILEFRGLPN